MEDLKGKQRMVRKPEMSKSRNHYYKKEEGRSQFYESSKAKAQCEVEPWRITH